MDKLKNFPKKNTQMKLLNKLWIFVTNTGIIFCFHKLQLCFSPIKISYTQHKHNWYYNAYDKF